MARSEVQRRWDEFHRTGMVTVAASPVRCVLMMLGSRVLALFPAVMAAGSFQEHGADSPTGWGCVLATLLFLVTAVLAARPLVRGSRLSLSRHGLAISARRRGERVRETGLRWEEMTHVERFSNPAGDPPAPTSGSTSPPAPGRTCRETSAAAMWTCPTASRCRSGISPSCWRRSASCWRHSGSTAHSTSVGPAPQPAVARAAKARISCTTSSRVVGSLWTSWRTPG